VTADESALCRPASSHGNELACGHFDGIRQVAGGGARGSWRSQTMVHAAIDKVAPVFIRHHSGPVEQPILCS
jgi:hypothetical protein